MAVAIILILIAVVFTIRNILDATNYSERKNNEWRINRRASERRNLRIALRNQGDKSLTSCPKCHIPIWEESEYCPHCDHSIPDT